MGIRTNSISQCLSKQVDEQLFGVSTTSANPDVVNNGWSIRSLEEAIELLQIDIWYYPGEYIPKTFDDPLSENYRCVFCWSDEEYQILLINSEEVQEVKKELCSVFRMILVTEEGGKGFNERQISKTLDRWRQEKTGAQLFNDDSLYFRLLGRMKKWGY